MYGQDGTGAVGDEGFSGLCADDGQVGFCVGKYGNQIFFDEAHDGAIVGDGTDNDFVAGFKPQ